MLSPEVSARLIHAANNEATYMPTDPDTVQKLGRITFAMFVGPSKMGKTTVMEQITQLSDITRVGGFVTRPPRDDDDPRLYRHIPHTNENVSQLLDRIGQGRLVQYFVDKNLGFIYGTEDEDYRSDLCMKDIFAAAVPGLRRKFPHSLTVGIVSEPESWIKRITEAYPHHSEQRTARLDEARQSLQFLVDEPSENVLWVHNQTHHADIAAKQAIDVMRNPESNDISLRQYAIDCLSAARMMR